MQAFKRLLLGWLFAAMLTGVPVVRADSPAVLEAANKEG
jgi:hypothetical protein